MYIVMQEIKSQEEIIDISIYFYQDYGQDLLYSILKSVKK